MCAIEIMNRLFISLNLCKKKVLTQLSVDEAKKILYTCRSTVCFLWSCSHLGIMLRASVLSAYAKLYVLSHNVHMHIYDN